MRMVVECLNPDGSKEKLQLELTDAEVEALRRANKEERREMIKIMVWNLSGDVLNE